MCAWVGASGTTVSASKVVPVVVVDVGGVVSGRLVVAAAVAVAVAVAVAGLSSIGDTADRPASLPSLLDP